MKLAVFGAGAVGGHIAARLARAGRPVSVIARGAHLAAIQQHGLTLRVGDDSFVCPVSADAEPARLGPQDVLVVAVKSTALPAAAPSLAPLIAPHTRIVFAMNGLPWWFADGMTGVPSARIAEQLDPGQRLRGLFPAGQVIWCVVNSGGIQVAPGVIRNTTPGLNALYLAYPDREPDGMLAELVGHLAGAGYAAVVEPRLRARIWVKLLMNAGHAMVATATERDTLQTVADPATRALVVHCMEEILAVGRSLGIEVDADPLAMTEPGRTSRHRSSFLQDLLAGRPLELSTTILAVLGIARLMAVPVPHLESVAAIVGARSADRAGAQAAPLSAPSYG